MKFSFPVIADSGFLPALRLKTNMMMIDDEQIRTEWVLFFVPSLRVLLQLGSTHRPARIVFVSSTIFLLVVS